MRADRSSTMSVSTQWRLTLELAFLPNQLVVSIQHYKVVDIWRGNEVLFPSGSWIDAPPSKEYDVRTWDVGTVSVSRQRWTAWYSNSSPFVFLSVQDTDVIEIAVLQLSALFEVTWLLSLIILLKAEPSLDDHVGSYLQSSVSLSSGWNWTLTLRLGPCHHLQIQHK